MESIDRLRRYVECHDKITGLTATCINHLIDSIEKEVDDMWHALTIDAKPMTDENMAESGWVRLPVDAEGVPIHIGDVMEWCDSGDTLEVIGIGDDTLFYVDPEGDGTYAEWTAARNKRHHHAPTVEDVLREFAEKITDSQIPNVHPTYEEAIAEYAVKLRLAEEVDE